MNRNITARKAAADIAVLLIVILIVIALLCLATRVFCWSFFIAFHARYLIGVVTAALSVKWIFFTRK